MAGGPGLYRRFLGGDGALLAGMALAKIAAHLPAMGRYGYFRDELYYIACGERLAWGYVDQPPLVAVAARGSRRLLGDSLYALRLLPALAGALKVVLTALLVRDLEGGRFAQVLAALAVIVAPIYLGIDHFLSMNAFEPLFWTLCALLTLRMLKRQDPRLWVPIGAVLGVGLLNKYSTLFFAASLVAGLLLSRDRRLLLSRWLGLGVLVAVVIVLPNLLWQAQNEWPSWQMLRNVAESDKNVVLSPTDFILQQVLLLHPLTLPLWLAGLWFYLFSAAGRPYRSLGLAYLVLLTLFIVMKAKNYYLAPIYPMLLAPGAVVAEQALAAPRRAWLRPALAGILLLGGLVTAPMALPVLPVESYLRYARAIGMEAPQTERHEVGPLPQQYADMHGWPEMAATVAGVYHRLPPEERAGCAIFGQNYGEAGAIGFFGRAYGLPDAISGHQNYYLWGPGDYRDGTLIVIGDNRENLQRLYDQVSLAAVHRCRYAMPYETNLPIFVCRGPRQPLRSIWPRLKSWR